MARLEQEKAMNTAIQTESAAGKPMDLAGDMFQTVGLAAAAGVGAALVSGLLVVLIALAAG